MLAHLIQLEKRFSHSTLTRVNDPWLDHYKIELWLKRDDLLHPVISGNKWRKLKFILEHALSLNSHRIISMGGAYSNHLHALAYAGKCLNIETRGIIRGEKPAVFSPTLTDLQNWGMQLKFVSRAQYRDLRHFKQWNQLPGLSKGEYWLPEGGSLIQALQGVAQMVDEISIDYHYLCLPCGTGTTLAGVINAVPPQVNVLGFSALKGGSFLTDDVKSLLSESKDNTNIHQSRQCAWTINTDYHFGGFAKINESLRTFIDDFQLQSGILLEPVYTGKMIYAIYDLIKQGYFLPEQRIIAVHTGGLQGNRGYTDNPKNRS